MCQQQEQKYGFSVLSIFIHHNEFNGFFNLQGLRKKHSDVKQACREYFTGVMYGLNCRKTRFVTVHAVSYHLLFFKHFADTDIDIADL